MSVPSLQERWRKCGSNNCGAVHWLQDNNPYVKHQESRIVALCQWKRRNNIPVTAEERLQERHQLYAN